jgi:hypothetical protein
MKPMQPSEHLAKIVGTEPLPRSEVTKKIWAHIKKHNLQNPKNKREILADDKLQPIFGSQKIGHVSDDQGGEQALEIIGRVFPGTPKSVSRCGSRNATTVEKSPFHSSA